MTPAIWMTYQNHTTALELKIPGQFGKIPSWLGHNRGQHIRGQSCVFINSQPNKPCRTPLPTPDPAHRHAHPTTAREEASAALFASESNLSIEAGVKIQ